MNAGTNPVLQAAKEQTNEPNISPEPPLSSGIRSVGAGMENKKGEIDGIQIFGAEQRKQ